MEKENMAEQIPEPVTMSLKQSTQLIYILYLVNMVIPFLGIVGVIIAYSRRQGAAPGPRSHFTYQIYTFWLSLLYTLIVLLLCLVFIGFLLIPVLAIWFIARVVVGLIRASEDRPIDNPTSWLLW